MVAEAQHRSGSSRARALAAHTAQRRWTRPEREHHVVAGCAEAGYVSSKSSWHERRSARRCGGRRFQGPRPTCEQMTSFRQIELECALRSIGSKTEAGKRRSRPNAVRHGGPPKPYDARTPVGRDLVYRRHRHCGVVAVTAGDTETADSTLLKQLSW